VVGIAQLVVACAVVALAAAATTALLRPDSRVDAAVTFGVVAAAGIAAALLLCGFLGGLTPWPALAVTALWAVLAVALAARAGRIRRRPALGHISIRGHGWETAIVGLATVALSWQLLVALVLPPYAYDALTYHLTIVATWLQQENLDPTPLSLCCAYYPANAELMFTWPALFTGDDSLVDVVQVGFAVLGALAAAGIARTAGLGAWAAAAAGALFVVTPAVLVQAPTNFADVIVAACALAALHALLRYAVTGAPQRLAVAGLAAGLVLGTKGTGIVWALVILAAGLVLAVRWWRRRGGRAASIAAATFLAGALALGAPWYARNWIETGNPVYPFQAEAAGVAVFDGPLRIDDVLTPPEAGAGSPWPVQVARSWAHDVAFWRLDSYDYQQRLGGLGPLWPWLALPLLVAFTVALVRRRSPVLLAIGLVAFVLLVQPYRWWARFTIPLTALGAIAIAWAATQAPRAWMRRAIGAAALALALAGVALSSYEVDPAARAPSLKAGDLLGLIGAPAAERSIGRLFFPEYRFVERIPDDATVVVDLRAAPVRFVYPLFGPDHSRRVLPAGAGPPPLGAWVVTGAGRPLERALAADLDFRLAAAARGVRVFAPSR
jgi:hypothetical protein